MHSFITKFVVACFVCVLVAGGMTPQTADAAPAPAPPAAALMDVQEMCSSTAVPAGWVVTQVFGTSGCAPFLRYQIQPVSGSVMDICSATAVPAGWVVTQVFGTSGCGTFLRYQIKPV